jgi:alkylhydroperoxidase/carboxymuconolactone decarboxylase family protein YurZ
MFFITYHRLSSLAQWRKNVNRIGQIVETRKRTHKKLLDRNSKTYRAFIEMDTATYSDGALPRESKELIAVGISVVFGSQAGEILICVARRQRYNPARPHNRLRNQLS